MTIDLNRLSARELDALINQARKRKTTLDKRKPVATVRNRLTALAKAEGYSISELFGMEAKPGKRAPAAPAAGKASASKGRKLGKVAPKYRNPANPKETWSGRGKQPRWLADMVGSGRTADEFLIGKTA